MIVSAFSWPFRRYRVQCCEAASACSPGCRLGTYAFVRVTAAIAALDRLCRPRGSPAAAGRPQLVQHLRFVPLQTRFNYYKPSAVPSTMLRLRDCDACAVTVSILTSCEASQSHRARCSNQHKQQQQAILFNCCCAAGARQSRCQLRNTRRRGLI